jgi:DNA polymerase (family X)
MQNTEIARRLEEVAWLLNEQGANPYRVQAYRHAAETLRRLDRPVIEILPREGAEGLHRLPGIGESLARSICELVLTAGCPYSTGYGARLALCHCSRRLPGLGWC